MMSSGFFFFCMNTSFILIPIISAFLGWLVCYLGIKYFVNNYITRKKDLLISNLSAELQKLLPFSKLEEKSQVET